MGIFSAFKQAADGFKQLTGGVDDELIRTGRPARGLILDVQLTGTTVQMGGPPERVCVFTLEVTLDDTQSYQAVARQRIAEHVLPRLQPGQTFVAVRVDPADPNRVAIDWASEPPVVRATPKAGVPTAAELLATGLPCEAVVIQSAPLGMRNPAGIDLHAFVLTILRPGVAPYQIQVGNPVPTHAVPLVYPGSRLQAKVSASEPNAVAIDWDSSVAAAQR
ncbi:DUF3592 domain-containing protein [Cryptosporangium aurantiacum]|uniref:Uncharacterized protein n=1 Tax=Cryptosporangium aurantiacum TaxID=134849 RepID=A0A1M7RDX1_9ACTN|nr:hypothetical protein [Cryptosporangium aurantiacum]SHN44523.1 hypothetical protein SAMN05443668_110242 [Cryptosporangium aurantiacum]